MRWPTLPAPEKGGNVIDQEEVNRLIDYAIEHGVNYFDTAPVYVAGLVGNLDRHRPETTPERKILHRHQDVELRPYGLQVERRNVPRLDEEAPDGLHRLLPAPLAGQTPASGASEPLHRQWTAGLSGKRT